MITKYIVEATTEAMFLSLCFGMAGVSILFCVEDYLRGKRKKKAKGR